MLVFVLAIPLLIVLYVRLQLRRRRMIRNFNGLGFATAGAGAIARQSLGAKRHIPPILFALALIALVVALARPQATLSLPRVVGTVILAFDVSGSMGATDMEPNRMDAAKAAAREFVQHQPRTVQVGIVAFSESGLAVQPPTNDKDALLNSINRLTIARGTSLASGISASLKSIALANTEVDNRYYTNRAAEPTPEPTPVPQGTFIPATIVLLTDGENNVPPDPLEAAQVAAERGVRIHTIGVGSPEGVTLNVEGFSVHTQLDEAALQQISGLTSGTYYNARTGEELRKIYDNVGQQLIIKSEATEITSVVAGIGVLLLLIGGALSLI